MKVASIITGAVIVVVVIAVGSFFSAKYLIDQLSENGDQNSQALTVTTKSIEPSPTEYNLIARFTQPASASKNLTENNAPVFINIEPLDNFKQRGVATIHDDTENRKIISFDFAGTAKNEMNPVAIYEGSCQSPLIHRYGLNPLKNGYSVTIFDPSGIKLLQSGAPLVIMIGKSLEQSDQNIACGIIR